MKLFCNFTNQLKNAINTHKKAIILPNTSFYLNFLKVLFLEGFISKIIFINSQKKIKIYLKYTSDGTPSFKEIKFLSNPNRFSFLSYNQLIKITDGLGIIFLSTNKGLLTHTTCIKLRIGGKALCYII